ncbi:MAG: universal stress protein [Bdellovibrionales bacterium]|nr:universal stress protein [Bdellovibrionales bacterium]
MKNTKTGTKSKPRAKARGKKKIIVKANPQAISKSKKTKKAAIAKGSPKDTNLIIWALDPFSAEGPVWDKLVETVTTLSLQGSLPIQPVYVLSPSNFNFTGDFSGAWVEKFEPKVRAAFAGVLEKLKMKSLQAPEILINKKPSLDLNVRKLLAYSEKRRAEVVVMNSHARRGLSRFFVGSFAETALMMTKTPLLLVNPDSHAISAFKKVLFPTDFTVASRRVFKTAINFCKKHGSQLIIYHKLPDPIEPMIQTGVYMAGGGWVSIQNYKEKESEAREMESRAWVEQAAKEGVEAKFYIEEKSGFITDSINQYISQHGVDMVAVGSKSGPLSSVLIGSVARQMVRESSCPVWVVHSK